MKGESASARLLFTVALRAKANTAPAFRLVQRAGQRLRCAAIMAKPPIPSASVPTLPVGKKRVRSLHGTRRAGRALGAVAVLLAGCVSDRAYRDRDSRPWPHKTQADFVQGVQKEQYEPFTTAQPNHRFDLSYIEFDEKGDYWDRRQLGWTVQAIKHATRAKDVVLVVYVHGWQNDASDLPGHDVGKFRCLLENLATADGGQRRFFGVYIGWRGKSVPGGDGWFKEGSVADLFSKAVFFVPHELSFYNRKDTATRVAGLPVTEAIFQSVAAARNGARVSGHRARTILIGHSFGALVLEKAMAQALAAKVISEDSSSGGMFTTPADFMILLNSAGESIYAKEMTDMLRRRQSAGGGADEISARHPLIVSITSKADWATGALFPIGTRLSNAGGTFRKYQWDTKYGDSSHNVSQREYFTRTPGHNDRLISHEAVADKGSPHLPAYQYTDGCSPAMLDAFRRNLSEPLTGPGEEVRFVTVAANGEETEWKLKPKLEQKLQTPYWIISVPKEIMRDHGDIFNENALAMMARLFRVSNPREQRGVATSAAPRTMHFTDPDAGGKPLPPVPMKRKP